jgi:hypothetical protein
LREFCSDDQGVRLGEKHQGIVDNGFVAILQIIIAEVAIDPSYRRRESEYCPGLKPESRL